MDFGEFFRLKRIEKKMALRTFCERYGFDPGNISKLERGRLLAPKEDSKLRAYASALDIKEETEDWVKFFDLAYTSRGELPEDIVQSYPNLINKLPLFFRTMNGKKVDEKCLKKMIELIKES